MMYRSRSGLYYYRVRVLLVFFLCVQCFESIEGVEIDLKLCFKCLCVKRMKKYLTISIFVNNFHSAFENIFFIYVE